MLRSLSRKLISCSIGRAYVPASWGRLISCYIPFLPSLTLSCSNSSDGISWASSIPDWHWLIDMSLYWSLWKKPPAKTIIKKFIQLSQNLIAFYSRFMFEKLWGFPTCMITHYEGFKTLPVKLTNSSMSFTFNGTCTIPQRW